ncbi:MAG: hypothetical protein LDL41_00975 [Coleofasciculus sp. S288]|nr:hypothetical protein [Coleofasciculus sp. S288]
MTPILLAKFQMQELGKYSGSQMLEYGRVYLIESWEADISVKPAPTTPESRCTPVNRESLYLQSFRASDRFSQATLITN